MKKFLFIFPLLTFVATAPTTISQTQIKAEHSNQLATIPSPKLSLSQGIFLTDETASGNIFQPIYNDAITINISKEMLNQLFNKQLTPAEFVNKTTIQSLIRSNVFDNSIYQTSLKQAVTDIIREKLPDFETNTNNNGIVVKLNSVSDFSKASPVTFNYLANYASIVYQPTTKPGNSDKVEKLATKPNSILKIDLSQSAALWMSGNNDNSDLRALVYTLPRTTFQQSTLTEQDLNTLGTAVSVYYWNLIKAFKIVPDHGLVLSLESDGSNVSINNQQTT